MDLLDKEDSRLAPGAASEDRRYRNHCDDDGPCLVNAAFGVLVLYV